MNEFDDSLTRIDWLNDLSINFDIVNISNAKFYLSESKDATLKQSKNNIDISSYISKNSLGKPPFSYATLISTAIKNSKSQKLTLSEIYDWISDNFPYFRNTGNGWKNSVRHNLSLNKSFMKISRSRDDPGKGSYWCLTRKHAKNIKNTEDKTKSLSKKTREQFNNVNDRCTEDTCSSHNTSSEINSPESIPFHGSMLNNNTQCSFDFFDEGSLVNEQIMDINHCNQNPDDSRAESFNQLDIKKVFHTIYTSIFPLEKNNSTLPSISSCLKSNENPVYLHNEDRYDTLAQGSNNSDEMRDIFEAASRLKTKSNVKENDLQMWRSCLKQRLYVVQSLDWDRISQSINQNDIKECILKAVNMSKENLTVERLKYLNNLIEKVISIANFVNEPISILTPDEYEESRNFIERLTSNHDYHYTIINPASIDHQQQTTDLALLSSFDSNPSHLLSTGLDMHHHHHHQRNKSFIWNQIV